MKHEREEELRSLRERIVAQQAEFQVGDKVTFKPYDRAMTLVVVQPPEYHTGRVTQGQYYSGRIIYGLGLVVGQTPTTITSGQSIVESKLFEPWDEVKDSEGI